MATKTETRLKYELSQRNQANMRAVETLLEREANTVMLTGQDYDRQEMGGFLRVIIPELIRKYGNINGTAAVNYYDEQRKLYEAKGLTKGQASRTAAKKSQSALYFAKMADIDHNKLADPIIGYSMARFSEAGFKVMQDQAVSAMTRAVASYNRDTILYNAGLDEAVVTVQRVAEPNACAFCAMMAFSSTRSASGSPLEVRTTSYAVDFHDRCRCSIETLYEGDAPIRPDYYDSFEQDYYSATSEISGPLKAKEVLAEMRVQTGRS